MLKQKIGENLVDDDNSKVVGKVEKLTAFLTTPGTPAVKTAHCKT